MIVSTLKHLCRPKGGLAREVIWFFLAWAVTTFAFWDNGFGTSPRHFFNQYQADSEALVLGKVIADTRKVEIPHGANLARVSINDFHYNPSYIFQSYWLVESLNLPEESKVRPYDLSDQNWNRGVGRHASAFIVLEDHQDLEKYVGRGVVLPNGVRTSIVKVERMSPFLNVYFEGPALAIETRREPPVFTLLGASAENAISTVPYRSSYGFQGQVVSFLFNILGVNTLGGLYAITALALGFVICVFAFMYGRTLGRVFTVLFILSMVTSPWMVAIGRNLYWFTSLWFLPAIFSYLYYVSRTAAGRWSALLLLFLSVMLKCLAGYEFISTILLFSAAIFIIDPFLPVPRLTKRQAAVGFTTVGLIGVSGFIAALMIHGSTRGDSVLQGIQAIYVEDVKRRTYGDASIYSGIMYQSLAATPWSVVRKYLFDWSTDVLTWVWGPKFAGLVVLTVLSLGYKKYCRTSTYRRDVALFLVSMAAPLSWYVLAKAHSDIHIHINYVLWYLGFVPACLYIIVGASMVLFVQLAQRAASLRAIDL